MAGSIAARWARPRATGTSPCPSAWSYRCRSKAGKAPARTPSSRRTLAISRVAGWKLGANRNAKPSDAIADATRSGSGSRSIPRASAKSALPLWLETARFPCFATGTPQAATSSAAAVEMLSPTMVANSDDEGGDEDEDEKDLSGEMLGHGIGLAEEQAAARSVESAVPERPHGFVVSKTKRGRFRRLHCVEACRLVPGVHYAEYDVWGDVLPGEQDIDAVCSRCLPQSRLLPAQEDEASEASSSSASGEEDGPALAHSGEGA